MCLNSGNSGSPKLKEMQLLLQIIVKYNLRTTKQGARRETLLS